LATNGTTDLGVSITADQLNYDREKDSYLASGNVRIERQGVVLTADSVTLSEGGERARAVGSVVLTRQGTVLRGDSMDIDLRDQTGEVSNGTMVLSPQNIRLSGARILKTGDKGYRLLDGTLTTCDTDPPSWYFAADEMDVTLEQYAVGKGVVFRAADVPLFYSPYFIVPANRERQSGFLYPRIGSSNIKGFFLQVPYYWAISPSMDATFAPGLMSSRGPLLEGEFRYLPRLGTEGSFIGTVMYDTELERFRGEASFKHRQEISPLTRLAANLNVLSDRDYYREFSDRNGVYNQQYLESTAYAATTGPAYALSADIFLLQNLDSSNDTTLQRLPRLAFNSFRRPIFDTPLFLTVDATATHFYREVGARGERYEVAPQLSWQQGLGDALNLTAWAGYRQRFYRSEGEAATDGARGDGIPQAGVTASTSLSRVYGVDGTTVRRIRHLMVPEVAYLWVDAGRQDRLPFYDYEDRVLRQNMVHYSLANYLTVREEQADGMPQYRDILSLVIGQGYSFSGDRRDLLTLVDDGNPFTDISVETTVYPARNVAVSLDGRYNPYDGRMSTFVATGDLSNQAGDKAAVSYRFGRDVVEYLEGRFTLASLRPFTFGYRSRYSFDSHSYLEHYLSVEYRRQCWGIILTYRHRHDDDEVQLGFSLSGLGSPGTFTIL
jgi:LPS-assembly protein